MNGDDKLTCAHEGCSCTFNRDKGIEVGDKVFCSQGCAEGAGCKHQDCECSKAA